MTPDNALNTALGVIKDFVTGKLERKQIATVRTDSNTYFCLNSAKISYNLQRSILLRTREPYFETPPGSSLCTFDELKYRREYIENALIELNLKINKAKTAKKAEALQQKQIKAGPDSKKIALTKKSKFMT